MNTSSPWETAVHEIFQLSRHKHCYSSSQSQFTRLAYLLSSNKLGITNISELALKYLEAKDLLTVCAKILTLKLPSRYKSNSVAFVSSIYAHKFGQHLEDVLWKALDQDPENIGLVILISKVTSDREILSDIKLRILKFRKEKQYTLLAGNDALFKSINEALENAKSEIDKKLVRALDLNRST